MFLQQIDDQKGGHASEINKRSQQSDSELVEAVYKALYGRHYLIVMDDIWSIDLWYSIKGCFPNICNKSRIMVTTRLVSVASDFVCCDPYSLEILGENESRNLPKEKVFAENACPSALEDTGRRIARGCKGLPSAIVVMAGKLVKSNTRESWENIAEDVNSTIRSANDNRCLAILSLCYNNLPIHLKLCFLYTAFCEGDSVLLVSEIIKVWVANGLLKKIRGKCLEDIAMEYPTDLVGRNLISVTNQGSTGKTKSSRIHDLLLELCRNITAEGQIHYKGTIHDDRILGMEMDNPNIRIWREIKKQNLDLFSSRFARFDNWANRWDDAAHYNLWSFRLRSIHLSSASQAIDDSTF